MITSLKKDEIRAIKEQYPRGARVIVDQMAPDPAPIEPGTIGTVDLVDDIGQIHCTFDNGRVLALVPEADRFHIHQPTGKVKTEWLRSCLRLTADEFIEICQELYGPQVVVHFDMDGLWIDKETGRDDAWSVGDDKLNEDLSEFFDLNIMSVHLDDENNTNVWINYVPGKPKAVWYYISGDGGRTWTMQILTGDEAAKHLNDGYMLVKTEPLHHEPKIKVIAIYDSDECNLRLYADTPNVEAELIDTGSADPSDTDYKERREEIEKRRREISDAYQQNKIFFIGEI